MTSRRMLHVAAMGVLAAGLVTSAAAQGTPACQPGAGPFDHLKCYKIKATKIKGFTADLTPLQPQFQKETGCKVVGPVEFCVPVCKGNVKPNPTGSVPPAQQEIDHLCYKIACPKNTPTLPAAAELN